MGLFDLASNRTIDAEAMAEIDRIVARHVRTPIGPEFMAPPEQAAA